MENKEYEKAKQESWTNWVYRNRDRIVDESPNGSLMFAAYADAFNCAYLLGMEAAKKEMLTANVDSSSSNVDSLERKQEEPKFKVGDKVSVHYPTGSEIGFIQEVMLDGSYDVDFGGGCSGHNISEYLLEPYTEPQEDKHFDNIIKDGFRNHNRLHIAAMIMSGMLSNFSVDTINVRTDILVKLALGIADALIEESEKKGGPK